MIAEANWAMSCTSFYMGEFDVSRKHGVIGSTHYHRAANIEFAKITQQNCGPLGLVLTGSSLWQLGFADQAFAKLNEAIDLAHELNHKFTLANTYCHVSQMYELAELGEQALEYGERSLQVADEQGFAFFKAFGKGCMGVGLKHLGRYKESTELLRNALNELQQTGSFILFPKYRCHLADALWKSGDIEAAEVELKCAFEDQSNGEYLMHAELLRLQGDFESHRGEFEFAQHSYREAISVSRRQNARFFELRAAISLCHLLQRSQNNEQILEILEPLYNGFTEGFDMPIIREARELLSSVRR